MSNPFMGFTCKTIQKKLFVFIYHRGKRQSKIFFNRLALCVGSYVEAEECQS